MTRRSEVAMVVLETVIAVSVGVVLCAQAIGGAVKSLQRRRFP